MNKYIEALDFVKKHLDSKYDLEKVEVLQELVDKATLLKPQKEYEWIPVEERLPDEDGEYLVYYSCEIDRFVGEDKECGYWIVNFDTDMEAFGEWQNIYHPVSLGFLDSEFNEMNTVVAWMPLPEPYKGE